MAGKSIFIASTGHNVGKTTIALGIMTALQSREMTLGYMKPVAHRLVDLDNINVDEDARLMRHIFDLKHVNVSDLSPIVLPRNVTADLLEGIVTADAFIEQFKASHGRMASSSNVTVLEGTGACGAGLSVGISTPQLAAAVGTGVILVTAAGGVGKMLDDISLHRQLCAAHGVPIVGVIANKCIPARIPSLHYYLTATLSRWNIPLFGCIPYVQSLAVPSMGDYEALFNSRLLTGRTHAAKQFADVRLIAASLDAFQSIITPSQLIITPASRTDIVTFACAYFETLAPEDRGGFILTGSHSPPTVVYSLLQRLDLPMMYVSSNSYDVMAQTMGSNCKYSVTGPEKVRRWPTTARL